MCIRNVITEELKVFVKSAKFDYFQKKSCMARRNIGTRYFLIRTYLLLFLRLFAVFLPKSSNLIKLMILKRSLDALEFMLKFWSMLVVSC